MTKQREKKTFCKWCVWESATSSSLGEFYGALGLLNYFKHFLKMESCHSNYLEGEKCYFQCFQVIILTFAHHLPMVSYPQTFYTQPQWGVYFVALEAFFFKCKSFLFKMSKMSTQHCTSCGPIPTLLCSHCNSCVFIIFRSHCWESLLPYAESGLFWLLPQRQSQV